MGVHLDPGEFIGVLPDSARAKSEGRRSLEPAVATAARTCHRAGRSGSAAGNLAYAERLAGQGVVHTFALAARFLRHTAANAGHGTGRGHGGAGTAEGVTGPAGLGGGRRRPTASATAS